MIALKASRNALALLSFVLVASGPAGAQTPPPGTAKTVFEDSKMIVTDNVLKPGEGSPSTDRGGLVLYYISGGTVEREFSDGTKQTVTRKTGQALMNPEKRPYAVTNTGKTTLRVITIKMK